jgi:hypothetical protein
VPDDEAADNRPKPDRTVRIDIFHHFPEGPIEVDLDLGGELTLSGSIGVTMLPLPAVRAILTVTPTNQGAGMPGSITVDTTNETALVEFVDDKGDVNAPAPAGAVVTFTSDNPSVATVATDATNPLQGDVTPVAEGTANIGATIADASGNPILEPDGVTPFTVASVAVTVGPGAADSATLVLSV